MSRLIAVVGPTATGKSALGLALAQHLGGEIVNADAMALYRGLDVGTAKPTAAERAAVPHHLLDVLDVTETASVAAYQRAARAAIEQVLAAGRTPVLVGGSGLYVQSVVDELEFPGTDPELRAELEAELAAHGPAELHARLEAVDPAAAEVVLPGNGRRIVRALEVIALTGRPFPARLPAAAVPRYDAVLLGVDRPTADLDARVARRVARMFAAGIVAETRALERVGLRDGLTAARAGVPADPGRRGHVDRSGRHRPGHAPLRPPAALLVPARQAGALARRRRTPSPRPGVGAIVVTCSSARVTAPRTTSWCSPTRTDPWT